METPLFFNRELSWLEFNLRVLEEAMDPRQPLLERVKFLSIFHSNLDEFFMVRVSGLKEQVQSGLVERSSDGQTPREQLGRIRLRTQELQKLAWEHLKDVLMPELAGVGVRLVQYSELTKPQRRLLQAYYENTVYPVLTPLAVDPGHPFPHISNLSLSLAVVIRDPDGEERFARVKIPQVLPRFIAVPEGGEEVEDETQRPRLYVRLEQLVAANLGSLFRGMEVVNSFPFRVVRDADLEIREDEAGDLLQTIEQSLARRRFGSVIALEVACEMPEHVETLLIRNLEIEAGDVYKLAGPLGLRDLMELHELPRPDLRDVPFLPRSAPAFCGAPNPFEAIRAQDILLHHPYDSFAPVVDFVRAAASDPDVLAIKQTIYRVGTNSPIVEALAQAAMNGKQVSVIVELKARFDEENNIEWARSLERVGAHVVYGDLELKTHCKVLLVARRDPDGIRRYVHLSTGNYNVNTARLYTDLGLFTCDPGIGEDASALFNSLTGYSVNERYQKLLVSPGGIRRGVMERIDREIEHARAGREARLIFKINALTDAASAQALYRASQAGVQVDLIVRSACCLVPGVAGLSEKIRVRSIVGRFLEHHRVYYFRNGGDEEVWLGSADLMGRNLDKRVETLFPIERTELRDWLATVLLPTYLRDTRCARELGSDGVYRQVPAEDGDAALDAQLAFLPETEAETEAATIPA